MSLSCPEEQNYAAVAKQIHETALEAEQLIFASEQQMRAAVNLPAVLVTSTAAITGLSASQPWDISLGTFVTTFDNTAGGSGSTTGSFTPMNFGFFTEFLGAGLYEVGLCLTVVASGAVDNDTYRQFLILHLRPDPTQVTGEREIQTSGIIMFESATGVGSEVSFVGHFRAEPGDRFQFLFTHGNVSSTMNINTGVLVWATKVSESTLNRVL